MKRQPLTLIQTKLHNPPEVTGNCFATTIACLLHLPIEAVPAVEDIMPDVGNGSKEGDAWVTVMTKFLDERGFCWMTLDEPEADEFYLAIGPSPRGINHCCIYQNGKLWHDPHPSGQGLVSVTHLELVAPYSEL